MGREWLCFYAECIRYISEWVMCVYYIYVYMYIFTAAYSNAVCKNANGTGVRERGTVLVLTGKVRERMPRVQCAWVKSAPCMDRAVLSIKFGVCALQA